MSSSDGFCSALTFSPTELGTQYTGEVPTARHPSLPNSSAISSSQNTPTSVAPPSPFPSNGTHHRTSSSHLVAQSTGDVISASMRPSSPTRSNSTSSVATQSSLAVPTGTIVSNPPLVGGGNVPGIAATGSSTSGGSSLLAGFATNISTPPQTPRSTSGSVSGIKRDASESEREESGGQKKRRRIAPTQVTNE